MKAFYVCLQIIALSRPEVTATAGKRFLISVHALVSPEVANIITCVGTNGAVVPLRANTGPTIDSNRVRAAACELQCVKRV